MAGVLISTSPSTGEQVGHWATHATGQVEQAVQDAHAALTVGDPHDPATHAGPIAREKQVAVLQRQVDAPVAVGVVAPDARLPFGDPRRSGYGRELSEEGIREFTNVRAVWIGARTPEELTE